MNLLSLVRPLEKLDSIIALIEDAQALAHKYAPDPYHNKQPLSEAFWTTLIGDVTMTSRPAESRDGENVSKVLELLYQFRSLVEKFGVNMVGLYDLPTEKNPFTAQFPTWDSMRGFVTDILSANFICGQPSFPRSFRVTDEGHIAMVPQLSEPGDAICVIYGAQVPFVLRRVTDGLEEELGVRYLLVGECYVHGMMDGEALRLGNRAEDFEIV
jgi:hypothetical protein